MEGSQVKTSIRVVYSTIEQGERETEREIANRRAATSYWQQGDHICGGKRGCEDCGDNLQLGIVIYSPSHLLCNIYISKE